MPRRAALPELRTELNDIKTALHDLRTTVDRLAVAVLYANGTQGATTETIGPSKPILWREMIGLGKEVWQGVDAQQYVDKERDSWN